MIIQKQGNTWCCSLNKKKQSSQQSTFLFYVIPPTYSFYCWHYFRPRIFMHDPLTVGRQCFSNFIGRAWTNNVLSLVFFGMSKEEHVIHVEPLCFEKQPTGIMWFSLISDALLHHVGLTQAVRVVGTQSQYFSITDFTLYISCLPWSLSPTLDSFQKTVKKKLFYRLLRYNYISLVHWGWHL